MHFRTGFLSLLALGAPGAASAQSLAVTRAAGTITEADVRRRIYLIADDSMGGRNTPSPGLTKTAAYIASQFRRFGLQPGGDGGTFLRSYPIVNKALLAQRSGIRFSSGSGEAVVASLSDNAALLFGPTAAAVSGGVVLVGGAVVAESLKADDFKDRIVVYVPGQNAAMTRSSFRLFQRLGEIGARGAVMVIGSDSVFANYARFQTRVRTTVGDEGRRPGIPVVAVREASVVAQAPGAQDQFSALRSAPATMVQPMPDWEGEISLKDTTVSATTAPDVVGILPGTHPVLKNEYVVFSAHMDHIGTAGQPGAQCRPVGADNICNGADDDGSGTVGVIELAQAFSQRGARPKRSVIFLTVSGEEHGLWGSEWFVGHPPVPLPQIVADLNADMIGRNWKDTIVAIGKEHSDLGATLNRVNAAHPELHMHAIDDRWPEERFYERSDHYKFAVKGVPILFFFNGVHADYHRATDSPDKIDAEKESRIVKLLFFLGQDVANAPRRPQWVPASYKEIVQPE
jgi:hypothetical protein